ncbi:MAG: peptide chain release factor N(5)-glutamine methyltransferase [Planctomycetaceae bacterium]|nr:peptide chain release factor N(5)-glutamine methyltransferase [Planctomycetaceae bacterium]
MSQSTSWTIGEILEWTTDYLKQNGSTSARLDAEVLLAHARECDRIELYTAFKDPAEESLRQAYRELVKRRAEGTPVAYLVGQREFYSMSFRVTPAVLIPRPETEFVLITLLDLIKTAGRQEDPLVIADVGTGSGNLACAAAAQLPNAKLVAIDIQQNALEVARENVERHQLSARIQLVKSDLFATIDTDQKFDYIISNPPYIGLGEKSSLPHDVVDQEPHTALFAGPTGEEILQRLLVESSQRLANDGWLISELSPIIADSVLRIAQNADGMKNAELMNDLSRQPRVLRVQNK